MRHACTVCGAPSPTRRCPTHAPAQGNTSWNGTRDRDTQRRFRTSLIQRDGMQCARCGTVGVELQAHHDTPTDGRMLCRPCHKAVDPNAR